MHAVHLKTKCNSLLNESVLSFGLILCFCLQLFETKCKLNQKDQICEDGSSCLKFLRSKSHVIELNFNAIMSQSTVNIIEKSTVNRPNAVKSTF